MFSFFLSLYTLQNVKIFLSVQDLKHISISEGAEAISSCVGSQEYSISVGSESISISEGAEAISSCVGSEEYCISVGSEV